MASGGRWNEPGRTAGSIPAMPPERFGSRAQPSFGSPSMSAGGRTAAASAIVLAAAALSAWRHVAAPYAEPVERDTALRAAVFADGWRQRGFAADLGAPFVTFGEEKLRDRTPYLHHPSAAEWLHGAAILGTESKTFGLRGVPALLTAAAAAVLFVLARRRAGAWTGAAAAVAFLSLPVIQEWGGTPAIELNALAGTLAFVAAWLWWRRTPGALPSLAACAAFAVLGLFEWRFHLLAPGIWLAELLAGRAHLRRSLLLLPAGIVAFGVVWIHYGLALGSFTESGEALLSAVRTSQSHAGGRPEWETALGLGFGEALAFWCRRSVGDVAGIAAAVAALILSAGRRRLDGLILPAVPLLAQALLTIFLFPKYSTTHGYLWIYLAAPLVLVLVEGAARAAAMLARPLGATAASVVAAAALAAVLAPGAAETWARLDARPPDTFDRELARLADATLGSEGLFLTPDPALSGAALHARAAFMPVFAEGQIAAVLDARDAGAIRASRVIAIVTEAFARQSPDRFALVNGEALRRGVSPESRGEVLVYDFGLAPPPRERR